MERTVDATAVARALQRIATPRSLNPVEETPDGQLRLSQAERDRAVWEEEAANGQFSGFIPDIRDPRVRAEVKRIQREQEAKLEERLIAAGLHVMQRRV